ncbi:site-specific DNA-methyltransferase [bacterium]|nr:site-specific DNA-methyltransferase [bacterium]
MIALPEHSVTSRDVVHHMDALRFLRALADNSVDAIVTDPPAGIAFMGHVWDKDKGGRRQWTAWMTAIAEECLRVLKPGGHALVWALPRTSHWTGGAWEDAGFEVRDKVYHLFGHGFPKSRDISKAIDREAGAVRKKIIYDASQIENFNGLRDTSPWLEKAKLAGFTKQKALNQPRQKRRSGMVGGRR